MSTATHRQSNQCSAIEIDQDALSKLLNNLTKNKLYSIDAIPCLLNTDPYNCHIFNCYAAPWASQFSTCYHHESSFIFNENFMTHDDTSLFFSCVSNQTMP
jgi:hypothetical protein